jgi:hypothetical protein
VKDIVANTAGLLGIVAYVFVIGVIIVMSARAKAVGKDKDRDDG